MDLKPRVDEHMAVLEWVVGAFEHALEHNQTRLVPYLIEVSEEFIFEAELPERRSSVLWAGHGR
jgi:hypothetical protein